MSDIQYDTLVTGTLELPMDSKGVQLKASWCRGGDVVYIGHLRLEKDQFEALVKAGPLILEDLSHDNGPVR